MTSTQEPMTMSTIEQALAMDKLWQKAFKGGNKSATMEFFDLYARCNKDAKKAIDTMRELDQIEKSKNYWKKISSGINAVSAFKAKTTFREGQVFYYGKLRPATE